MRCYEWTWNDAPAEGLFVQPHVLRSGHRIAVVKDDGGILLPVVGPTARKVLSSDEQKGERILYARLGTTRTGRPKLIEADGPAEDGAILILLHGWGGYRGSAGYDFPDGVKVVASGTVKRSPRGSLGWYESHFVLMPEGAEIHYRTTGRLYGAEGHWVLRNVGGRLLAAPASEMELLDDPELLSGGE